MTRPLDGPRLEPRGRTPSALVVLLHGYGANGDDLIALGDGWRRALPDVAFVAPNAPQTIPGMHGGLQWFALTMRDPERILARRGGRPPALDRFLDAELARYRLAADRLVLVGFSQGTMMALHVGLRRAAAPAGIVAYSGLLAGPEHLGESDGAPADPADPRRGRRPDPGRGAAHRRARRWRTRACWSSGTCGRASATASIPRASSWPGTSSPSAAR